MKPICRVNSIGNKFWSLNHKLHREDGPAYEGVNGTKEWFINGIRHREDGPACEYSNGAKVWYINGHLHREDGPAYEGSNGNKRWFYHDKEIDCKDNEEFLRMIKLMAFL